MSLTLLICLLLGIFLVGILVGKHLFCSSHFSVWGAWWTLNVSHRQDAFWWRRLLSSVGLPIQFIADDDLLLILGAVSSGSFGSLAHWHTFRTRWVHRRAAIDVD